MNRAFQPRPARHGTTLIEVLLGLVILSTLLVSVAMARGRFLRQWADAEHRITVVKAADSLLSTWLSGPPQAVPVAGQGLLDGLPDYTWHTRLIHDDSAESMGALLVRLEIFDRRFDSPATITVDFLLHNPKLRSIPVAPK
jgi:Tfp pilus assembly protein PilV